MTVATTDTDPQAALADAARLEVRAQLDPSPAEAWPALRRRLAMLLQEGAQAKDFPKRLAFIEAGVRLTLEGQEDDSLFVLVQMLSDRSYGYCATHALTSAITCLMLAPLAKLDTADTDALLRAALRPGDIITLTHVDGALQSLNRQISNTLTLSVARSDDGFAVNYVENPLETEIVGRRAVITSSLFAAGQQAVTPAPV